MSETQAAELLQRASREAEYSTLRKLLTAAAFAAAALDGAVLVGGAAVELHTAAYRPTDIDLVGYRKPGAADSLRRLGFKEQGRHWLYRFADGETLAIEVPGNRLGDFAADPPPVIDLAPGGLAVISLNDLMMDRLLQATGGEPVTFEEAVRLAVAAYDRIDWAGLAERVDRAGRSRTLAGRALPAVLRRVRREAVRLLRRRTDPGGPAAPADRAPKR